MLHLSRDPPAQLTCRTRVYSSRCVRLVSCIQNRSAQPNRGSYLECPLERQQLGELRSRSTGQQQQRRSSCGSQSC